MVLEFNKAYSEVFIGQGYGLMNINSRDKYGKGELICFRFAT